MIYRAVFHVDSDDAKQLTVALTNVTDLIRAIQEKHYELAILFNGPAVTLLQEETTLCASYYTVIQWLWLVRVSFKVCLNALNRFAVSPDSLIYGCEIVPAGIVTLIELQQQGYTYIKP